jgi:hypothetical protein
MKGLQPARLAPVFLQAAKFDLLEDEQGPCYRLSGGKSAFEENMEYDVCMTDRGYASITKLTWDFRLDEDDSELGEIGL